MPAAERNKATPKPGTLSYAAATLGVSLPTIYVLIKAGKLRTFHIGRAHRVSLEAIADCTRALERESANGAASVNLEDLATRHGRSTSEIDRTRL
jgi:excisionase family DNA binding protein